MSYQGIVQKWFPEKGMGFIKGPGHPDGAEVFVYYKDIVDPVYGLGGGKKGHGTISLTVGGTVYYDVKDNQGKVAATNVSGAIGPRLDMSDPEQALAVATGEIQTQLENPMAKKGKGQESYGKLSSNATGVTMGKGKGVVKGYDFDRGFGWIKPLPDANGKMPGGCNTDLFVHVSRLPVAMRCPNKDCGRMVTIKTKLPHNEPKVPDQMPVKNGDVEFEVSMQEGKLAAVDLRGWGNNPGIVISSPLLLIGGGKGMGMITDRGPLSIEGRKRPGDELGGKAKGGKDGPPSVAPGWDDPPPAPAPTPEPAPAGDGMPTFACDDCDTQFKANPGTTIKCPGCGSLITI